MRNKVYIFTKKHFFTLALMASLWLTSCAEKQEIVLTDDASLPEMILQDDAVLPEDEVPVKPQEIVVHVCGAVFNEGVYSLPEEARIADAIAAAGGLTEDADGSAINQAAHLTDGMRLRVPFLGEETSGSLPEESMTAGEPGGNQVNINTASASELCTLSGIGEKKAADIIRYRETHGFFMRIEDITQVDGVGEKLFEKIRAQITVSS